jgi:hypothetical protein
MTQTQAEYVANLAEDPHVSAITLLGGYALTTNRQQLPFAPATALRETRDPKTSRVKTGLYRFPDGSLYEITPRGVKTS